MLHKFRLLLTTFAVTFLLIACGSETNEDASSNELFTVTNEVHATGTVSEKINTEDVSSKPETPSETVEAKDEAVIEETPTEETAAPEEESKEQPEQVVVEETAVDEGLEKAYQTAIDNISIVTGLNVENHLFSFEHVEDYIQVEVREKMEENVTPLVGVYRYEPVSNEVLIRDYLTGEFIPFEATE